MYWSVLEKCLDEENGGDGEREKGVWVSDHGYNTRYNRDLCATAESRSRAWAAAFCRFIRMALTGTIRDITEIFVPLPRAVVAPGRLHFVSSSEWGNHGYNTRYNRDLCATAESRSRAWAAAFCRFIRMGQSRVQ